MILIILTSVLFLILTAVCKIPKEKINIKSKESAFQLNEIGEKRFIKIFNKNITNFYFTDILMVNICYSIDSNNPIKSAMLMRKNYTNSTKSVELMPKDVQADFKYRNQINGSSKELLALTEDQISDAYIYARYWHGYVIILRPLLLVFNYSTIIYILLGITIVLVALAFYKLFKDYSKLLAFLFLLSVILSDMLISALCINTNLCFLISLIGMNIILYKKNLIKNYTMFFYVLGILTNFFDLLTNPILTLGLPLITYFIRYNNEFENETEMKNKIIIFTKMCISWGIGYLLFWTIKWILCDVFFDLHIIENAFNQILYRTNSPNITIDKLIYGIGLEIDYKLLLALNITSVILIVKNTNNNLSKYIEYIVAALLPITWMLILKEHSTIHHFFTYRNLFIYIFANLIIIAINTKEQYKKYKGE